MKQQDLDTLIEAINKSTSATVETVVNGKIRRLDEKLTEYISHDMDWKKEKVEPLIDAHSTVKNVAIFVKWSAGIVGGVTAMFVAAKVIIKYIA